MRVAIRLLPFLLILFVASCGYEPYTLLPESESPVQPAPSAGVFDSANTGTITGRVTWDGPPPSAPNFLSNVPNVDGSFKDLWIANPNRPAIDEKSHAVAGAVVFLRGIFAAKPWDLKPVRIEMKNLSIFVVQGDEPRRVGFVRRGESVAMTSKEHAYHVLRARGAAYFSLAFPEPEQPLSRTFDKPGRVELSSGAGYYWASADLFVVDHPYYAVTDRDGRFSFTQVPAGPVEVVAWLPGWNAVKQERDPETGMIFRQTYSDPIERSQAITLAPKATISADIRFPK